MNGDSGRAVGPTTTEPVQGGLRRDGFCNLAPLQIPRPKCSGMEFVQTRGRQGFYMSLRRHPQMAGIMQQQHLRTRRTPLSEVRFAPHAEEPAGADADSTSSTISASEPTDDDETTPPTAPTAFNDPPGNTTTTGSQPPPGQNSPSDTSDEAEERAVERL